VAGITIIASVLVVMDARVAVVRRAGTAEGPVELAVHLRGNRGVRLVSQVLGRLCGLVDLGGCEECAPILEGAVPIALLEDPALGLADPLRGDPGPTRLNFRPEPLLPDDAVAVGVILPGDIEAIFSGGLAGILVGPLPGRSILAVVEAIG